MSPSGLISFIILVAPILLLLIVALVWKKARTLLLVLAIVIASAEVYYVLYIQEASLQEWYEHEAVVDAYLKKAYEDEDWVIRRETSPSFFSNGVEVIFIDEPQVAYLYLVENDEVSLVGYSAKEGYENPKRQE